MADISNKNEIDRIYNDLSARADELYRFVMHYYEYINRVRDYGTGELISMVEVHTLSMIEDNPGITVSELALMWDRTKGAVSQNVAKLEKRGCIYRKNENGDSRTVHLYPTEEGVRLSTYHKLYDNIDIIQTQQVLLNSCTIEDIDTFYKVVRIYSKLFQ